MPKIDAFGGPGSHKTPTGIPLPRVLVAEDHALVREGLRQLLSADFDVVDVVADGRALLDVAARVQPDVILLDIRMPEMNGLEAARQLRQLSPKSRLVFVSALNKPEDVREAFRAGAVGFVDKCSDSSHLFAAIGAAAVDRRYLSLPRTPELEVILAETTPVGPHREPLTKRQREVLQLVAEGHTARAIAAKLGISRKTVEYHKTCVMRVLRLQTIAELTRYALEYGVAGR